jgi:hypothetical protein
MKEITMFKKIMIGQVRDSCLSLRGLGCLFVASCLFSVVYAATPGVSQFKQSWTYRALALQRDIDVNAPLNQATFIGTHNSENAISYQIPFIRYVDPNQILSIYDQLEVGVRSVEYDVHWYLGAHFKKDILLCHALANHLGCSSFDRPVTEGLAELRDWLKSNPGEVVLLYFDRSTALDGHEPRLTNYLQEYLGDFIYKPTVVRDATDHTSSCVSLPGTISKADVLKAGKQLLLITKKCDGTNPSYEEQDVYKLNWNDYVFAGMGNVPNNQFNFIDSTIGSDFTAYPDCSKSTVFADDPAHTTMWRIFEDRTILSNILEKNRLLLADDMKTMVNCGINWQTMDMLSVGDDRLTAAIWSWAPNFPAVGKGDCAVYKNGGGIENSDCKKPADGFVCQHATTHEFKAVATAAEWQDGEKVCQATAGVLWHFAMPINGNQMFLLKQMVGNAGLSEVWLNYRANVTGRWEANK